MEKLRRGTARAAFEADRLIRANRVRSEITAIEGRIEHEQNQMGARLVDLFVAGLLQQQEFEPGCERVLKLRSERREKELDIQAIHEEPQPEYRPSPRRDSLP